MEETKVINIPKGYEIDRDQSNDKQIVLKKIEKAHNWNEYCEKMKGKSGWWIDDDWNVVPVKLGGTPIVGEFKNKKDAEAFAALGKLISFRRDWIGKWEPNWSNNEEAKFVPYVTENVICYGVDYITSHSISFPTMEMCQEFLETFKDLLEQAKRFI